MRGNVLVLVLVLLGGAAAAEEAKPQWISAAKEMPDKQANAYYRLPIDLPQLPTSARLLAAGDGADINFYFDDKLIHEIDAYDPLFKADVTEHLARGKHFLAIRSRSYDPGSMFFLRLHLKFADGSSKIIATNADWQCALNEKPKDEANWKPAHERFPVDDRLLIPDDRRIDIAATDNYEQWRQASGAKEGTDPAKFFIAPGFQIDLVRSAKEGEDSWISLVFDPQGRAIISQEQRGLLRMTLAKDGGSVEKAERIDNFLEEVRGMAFLGKDLYVNANNSKAMYRLRPKDSGELGSPDLLFSTAGGVGHGRNDLAVGPDGSIYSIHGDSVQYPSDNTDFTPAFRLFDEHAKATDGYLIRYSPVSKRVETLVAGLRNPYGIAFNDDGEAFTYDADAEFDMGTPWYRPTRINHLTIGSDFGWRAVTGKWPPYYSDHPDVAPHNLDIGKGSPTAVIFGRSSNFPSRYKEALFICDWAYGRILAVHCLPRGASYLCEAETFLKGRPLNVTDIEFSPDGSMYLITGGRKTQSALYRVRFTGEPVAAKPLAEEELCRREQAAAARATRRKLEALLMQPMAADADLEFVWKQMAAPDPWLRGAAGHVLERQGIGRWLGRALDEMERSVWLPGALEVARTGARNGALVERLNRVDLSDAPRKQRQIAAWLYQSTGGRLDKYREGVAAETRARVSKLYPDREFAVNKHLSFAALATGIEDFVPKTMQSLAATHDQAEQLHYLFVLPDARSGWTEANKAAALALVKETKHYVGGEGMPKFQEQLVRAYAKLPEVPPERIPRIPEEFKLPAKLKDPRDLFFNPRLLDQEPITIAEFNARTKAAPLPEELIDLSSSPEDDFAPRSFVKKWSLDEAADVTKTAKGKADLAMGLKIFKEGSCSKCHRCGQTGTLVGPDLTAAASRFGERDLLDSIINPSKSIAENYRSLQIVTTSGQTFVGRPALGGDYRSQKLRLNTDPAKPFEVTEIDKNEIETEKESTVSFMPEGLLNTLTAEEIRDLLAFIASGGK